MLFFKECKYILRSIIYFAFVVIIALFYASQLGNYVRDDIKGYMDKTKYADKNSLVKPEPNSKYYGYKSKEIPDKVMPNMVANLIVEYNTNNFGTYPIGFYKSVKLNNDKLEKIDLYLREITALSPDEITEIIAREDKKVVNSSFVERHTDYSENIPIKVDYKRFKQIMLEVSELVGKGSSYEKSNFGRFSEVPKTYEESLKEYNMLVNNDKISGAYARLFCDYMGIVAALFSIFVPTSYLLRDKSSKIQELIYYRKISSVKLVITRYFALIFMMLIPFIMLSLIPTVQLSIFGIQNGFSIDYFAFIKYIIFWILPTLLFVTAISYVFTTLTGTPIVIFIQFIWSFIGIMSTKASGGDYGLAILIRHNQLGGLDIVNQNINSLIINRTFYICFAFIMIGISIYLFEIKRGGGLKIGIRKNKVSI